MGPKDHYRDLLGRGPHLDYEWEGPVKGQVRSVWLQYTFGLCGSRWCVCGCVASEPVAGALCYGEQHRQPLKRVPGDTEGICCHVWDSRGYCGSAVR